MILTVVQSSTDYKLTWYTYQFQENCLSQSNGLCGESAAGGTSHTDSGVDSVLWYRGETRSGVKDRGNEFDTSE